jgi:[ribosomal protein S18]-alanine N-acetyltransferase
MEYHLQPATLEDLRIVLGWITSPEELRLWGGPALSFPPVVEKTWQEIDASDQNTFSLMNPKRDVVGFGQTLFREPNTVHLARIIVSPALRGEGIGRILCQQLMRAGVLSYRVSAFTLNVYTDNTPAVKLYRSLGFTVVAQDTEQNWFRMRLQPDAGPAS